VDIPASVISLRQDRMNMVSFTCKINNNYVLNIMKPKKIVSCSKFIRGLQYMRIISTKDMFFPLFNILS
jgi:hypothetical protein